MTDATISTETDVVGYALQIQSNASTSRAFWKFDDDEFGSIRHTLDEAQADLDEALGVGYVESHLRIVALTVVVPPDSSGSDSR